MRDFTLLQQRLAPAWRLGQPPGGTEHVRVVLPSYNLGAAALRHYAYRLPALEHRFLVEILQLARVEACTLVFVFCQAPDAEVIDYYLSLLPPETSARIRPRIATVVIPTIRVVLSPQSCWTGPTCWTISASASGAVRRSSSHGTSPATRSPWRFGCSPRAGQWFSRLTSRSWAGQRAGLPGVPFPGQPGLRMQLTTYGQRVGRLLAERQVIGAASIDFVAARDRGQQWRLCAVEVNLRRFGGRGLDQTSSRATN